MSVFLTLLAILLLALIPVSFPRILRPAAALFVVTGAVCSYFMDTFGVIIDAIPGRVNETWFKIEKPGVYYGSCRELCGVDHAFMPIEVKVVTQAEFDAWVAKKGGSLPGAGDGRCWRGSRRNRSTCRDWLRRS